MMDIYLRGNFPTRGRFVFNAGTPDNYRSINRDIVADAVNDEWGRLTLRCLTFWGVQYRGAQ